jgi:hypothetical protein
VRTWGRHGDHVNGEDTMTGRALWWAVGVAMVAALVGLLIYDHSRQPRCGTHADGDSIVTVDCGH